LEPVELSTFQCHLSDERNVISRDETGGKKIGFTALTSTAVSEGSRKKTFFHPKKQQKLVSIPN